MKENAFKKAINSGFEVCEFHQTNTGNYTVHVMKDSFVRTFTNISQGLLGQSMNIENIPTDWISMEFDSEGNKLSFEEALASGFEVMEFHKHKGNPRYTVHVQKGEIFKHFTNVGLDHLLPVVGAEALGLDSNQGPSNFIDPKHLKFEEGKFFLILAIEAGMEIRDYQKHENNDGYTVHLVSNTIVKPFPNVSGAHLSHALGKKQSELENVWKKEEVAEYKRQRTPVKKPSLQTCT